MIEQVADLPLASHEDWQAACHIRATEYDGVRPIEWTLYDGYGDAFAVAYEIGGHD